MSGSDACGRKRPLYVRADRSHYSSSKKRKAHSVAAAQARWNKENTPTQSKQTPVTSTKSLVAAPSLPAHRQQQQENIVAPQCTIDGCRIVNIQALSEAIHVLTTHSTSCGGSCIIEGETRSGLASVFHATCTKCHAKFPVKSSDRITPGGSKVMWSVNVAAVLAQMATGGGLTRLNSTLSFLEVPGMQKRMYLTTEQFLGEAMQQQLFEAMAQVGVEEKQHAIDTADYHQGVPAVSVVADGGWSKRSHKHSYNAKSGVAVIFGVHTKKLLFLGVRNKYCSICAIAEKRHQEVPTHKCYKNWEGSSSSMESDIVAEGFRLSEQHHGVRYMRVTADGDSSLMSTLIQSVPYGPFIQKVECANHACKCYRSRLEALAKDHSEFRGKGGLTKRAIQRLTIGARIAIRMHSSTGNVQQLRHDLRNGPRHVFGDHSLCNPEFCKHVPSSSPDDDSSPDPDDVLLTTEEEHSFQSFAEQIDDIVAQEIADNPTTHDEADAQIGQSTDAMDSLPAGLFAKVMACGDRLVVMAPQLISNQTSNLAECFMSIRCCFDGGKQYNRIQKGSFQYRCCAAGLRVQNGCQWPVSFWKETTGEESGQVNIMQYT